MMSIRFLMPPDSATFDCRFARDCVCDAMTPSAWQASFSADAHIAKDSREADFWSERLDAFTPESQTAPRCRMGTSASSAPAVRRVSALALSCFASSASARVSRLISLFSSSVFSKNASGVKEPEGFLPPFSSATTGVSESTTTSAVARLMDAMMRSCSSSAMSALAAARCTFVSRGTGCSSRFRKSISAVFESHNAAFAFESFSASLVRTSAALRKTSRLKSLTAGKCTHW